MGVAVSNIPAHVAIIMDGNGRWAERRGLSRVSGHKKGVEAAREIVKAAREIGVKYLTLYTFSKENWNRPAAEVNILMTFLEKYILEEADMMMENNIRFKAIGCIDDLPSSVRKVITKIEEKTSGNTAMTLLLALSYGSRDELIAAARKLATDVKSGVINPDSIDERAIEARLYTSGIPDPDLLIRTSGEMRVSNFLLWQIAYSEFYVTDVLWPDFTRDEFLRALDAYRQRERRFGLTHEQLTGRAG